MADEKVVKYDKKSRQHVLSSARGGKNAILVRYIFAHPLVCKLDAYIKDTCLHREPPKEGTLCHNCATCNQCVPALAGAHGGAVKFTPSPVNAERRVAREQYFRAKKRVQESVRANQRNLRYHQRAVVKRAS